MNFTHLHTHTEYSMLDGISRIPELVEATRELGMTAAAITDHGTFHGVVDFYSECKEKEIKPIVGCEVYVALKSRHIKDNTEKGPHHLVLLARDNTGYRNLMELVTKSNTQGFYNRPRIDRELMELHRDGLVCLSGCASAEIPRLIVEGRDREAAQSAGWYREIFGDGYFLELQQHDHVPDLDRINQGLIKISRETGIPLVGTNDSHYVKKEQAHLQDIYICIQTGTNIEDEKRLRMEDDSYYVKSPDEMMEAFQVFSKDVWQEAIENTQVINDMCNVTLEFGQTHLPRYDCPDGLTADEYLDRICREGFARKYPNASQEAKDRLEYEMGVIRYTQFANYFLVVWDIIKFVKDHQILFGVRGSAAASVVIYSLGITDIDPLEYRLVFERFLNMERKEMPDIDMDFQDDRRDEVLNYVIGKYGSDKVAQIVTFGTLGAKAALKDVGRALGRTYGETDRISKMVPFKAKTLEHALEVNPDMKALFNQDERVRELIERAMDLEGLVHHVGTHAAGVLISEDPLTQTVPLQRPAKGDENSPVLMTQFSMDPVAKLGLLKMDFLGLTSLTILDQAIKILRESRGIEIDLQDLAGFDDPETFALLSSGNTTNVFQLESSGMQRYIRELKPSNLGDIAAMIALYRPGPMENIDRFIESKHGRTKVSYPHESFKEILDETYGVIVYQDQVLMILQQFAGYTLGAADIVRKAMGKKIAKLMIEERENFITGAESQEYDRELAGQIFDLIEPFAGYAFNKSHSVSYAVISYWTGYFKTHYPTEYMAAVLNARMGSPDRVQGAINECFRLGIPVMLPDVNRSNEMYTIDQDETGQTGLRMGFSAIKQVSAQAAAPLVAERNAGGEFRSMEDFCRRAGRAGVKRRTLENMAKAGGFDSMAERGAVTGSIEKMMATITFESKMKGRGQNSLFAQGEETPGRAPQTDQGVLEQKTETATPEQMAEWEKELLGVALSHNPLLALTGANLEGVTTATADLSEESVGEMVNVLGIVSLITKRERKDGQPFWIVTLEMLGGILDVTVWPEVLHRTIPVWETGKMVQVLGRTRSRNDRLELTCERAEIYIEGETREALISRHGEEQREEAGINAGPQTQGKNQDAPVRADIPEFDIMGDYGPPEFDIIDEYGGQDDTRTGKPQSVDQGDPDDENLWETEEATAEPGLNEPGRNEWGLNESDLNEPDLNEPGSSDQDFPDENPDGEVRRDARGTQERPWNGRTVTVSMEETDNPQEDIARLRKVLGVLLDHQGTDRVNLHITTGRSKVTMDMPVISTRYGDDLAEAMEAVLGPGHLALAQEAPDLVAA